MNQRRVISLSASLIAILACACAEEDKEAPPPPRVDAVTSPTSLQTQLITGSAEYGATVRIEGPDEAVVVTADAFTARFNAEVKLLPDSANTLEVTATDAAGNRSAATTLEIVQESPRPESLTIEVPDPIVDADSGTLTVLAQVDNAEEGVALSDFEVSFSLGGYDEIADQIIVTDTDGRAQVTFLGIKTSGAGLLTVSAGGLTRTADFVVVAGKASALELRLSAEGQESDALEALVPGTAVTALASTTDAQGNTTEPPIVVVTDAPGALIQGRTITGIIRAGRWTVAASVLGSDLSASATMTFIPGQPADLRLTLDRSQALAGEVTLATTELFDVFGNRIDNPPNVALTLDPSPDAPLLPIEGAAITIESPARAYTVLASIEGAPDLTASAPLTIAAAAPSLERFSFALAQDTIQAGGDVPFTYSVRDAFDNPVPGVTVDVSLNAPGALVANNNVDGGTLTALTRAGNFNVTAQVRGTNVLAQSPLEVTPGDPAEVQLELSTTLVALGNPVEVALRVSDAFGNPTTSPSISLTCSDPDAVCPTPAQNGDEIVFSNAGTFRVSATESVSGDTDSRFVTVTADVDFTPPSISITSPSEGDEFTSGTPIVIQVDASDLGGLLEIGISTRGLLQHTDLILLPPNTTAVEDTFSFTIPSTRFGAVTITAFARDQRGNQANSQPVTILSQFQAVNDINCDSCDQILTVAAGFREGGFLLQGNEGGLREPQEIVLTNDGDIFVGLFRNIRLQTDNGFFGTQQIEQFIALILPDNTTEPFAPLEFNDGIDDQEVIGLAYDELSSTLYASLGQNANGDAFTRVVAYTQQGIIDPFVNATGDRDLGMAFLANRLFVVDSEPDPDRVYVVDPGRIIRTVVTNIGDDVLFDVCGDQDTLYITREDELHGCDLAIGNPTTCNNRRRISNAAALQASNGFLRSCAVAPSGRIFVANEDAGTIVAVDPDNGNNVQVIASGLRAPVGVDFDPTTGDLIVSDRDLDAVFRLTGDF